MNVRTSSLAADPGHLRDLAIAEAARRHAAAMRTNILTGHQQTLETLAEDFAHRVSQPGVTEQLVRATVSCGSAVAGQMLVDLIGKGIDAEAEAAAIKEIEHREAGVTSKDRQQMDALQVQREISAAYASGVAA